MIKAVGLDLDDTLYDRNQIYKKTFTIMEQNVIDTNLQFHDFNKIFQEESYKEFQNFAEGIKSEQKYKIDRVVSAYKKIGKTISDNQALIFHSLYLYYRSYIEIRPGMEKLINYLQSEDLEVFILTNGSKKTQLKKLHNLGIEKKFQLKISFFQKS